MRAPLVAVLSGLALSAAGAVALVINVTSFVASPYQLDSFSSRLVYTLDGELVQYDRWLPGPEVTAIGAGVIVVVAALVFGAAGWRPRRAR